MDRTYTTALRSRNKPDDRDPRGLRITTVPDALADVSSWKNGALQTHFKDRRTETQQIILLSERINWNLIRQLWLIQFPLLCWTKYTKCLILCPSSAYKNKWINGIFTLVTELYHWWSDSWQHFPENFWNYSALGPDHPIIKVWSVKLTKVQETK